MRKLSIVLFLLILISQPLSATSDEVTAPSDSDTEIETSEGRSCISSCLEEGEELLECGESCIDLATYGKGLNRG